MSNPILTVSGLTKSFQKDSLEIEVLKGIDLTINEGDFITIMGPSGAGKSTFLHILGTLDKPTNGDIKYRDRSFRTFTGEDEDRFRNEMIGFVFQFYHLLQDFTVVENIMMPLWIRRTDPEEALEKAESYLNTMGLAHRRNHKPGELSGGEQQRVAIARALITGPQIILADEPTGNLDRKTGQEVLQYLLSLNEQLQSTLILVTHDPETGLLGTRHLHMVDGRLSHDSGQASQGS